MQIKLSFCSGHLHFVERSTARRIPHCDVCLLDISTGCLSSSYLILTTPKTTLVSSLSWACSSNPRSVKDSFIIPVPWLKNYSTSSQSANLVISCAQIWLFVSTTAAAVFIQATVISRVLGWKSWPQSWHSLPSGGGSVYPPREPGLALHLLWPTECAGSDVWALEPRPQDSVRLHHRSLKCSGCHVGESKSDDVGREAQPRWAKVPGPYMRRGHQTFLSCQLTAASWKPA